MLCKVQRINDSGSYSSGSQQPLRCCFQIPFPFSWAYLEVQLQAEPWALRPPTTSFPKHHWLQNHIVTLWILIRYPMSQMTKQTHIYAITWKNTIQNFSICWQTGKYLKPSLVFLTTLLSSSTALLSSWFLVSKSDAASYKKYKEKHLNVVTVLTE